MTEPVDDFIRREGPWSAHNLQLPDGKFTMTDGIVGDELKVRRVVQTILDAGAAEARDLRVLDLACLEGIYGIEFARQGAEVVFIEGRAGNLRKAEYVCGLYPDARVTFVLDDVQSLSRDRFGEFDVVLCLGIIYELDQPDVFRFAGNVFDVTRRMTVFDVNFCLEPEIQVAHRGRSYWGGLHREHAPDAVREDRLPWIWASLSHNQSFWFTRPSFLNLLNHLGYTSVVELLNPAVVRDYFDRGVFLALKGVPLQMKTNPLVTARPPDDWPEHREKILSPRVRIEPGSNKTETGEGP